MSKFTKTTCIITASIIVFIALISMAYVLYIKTSGKKTQSKVTDTQTVSSPEKIEDKKDSTVTKPTNSEDYTNIVKTYMDTVPGSCQWGYIVFSENAEYCTDSFAAPSASIIKVFIMEYAFNLIEKGEISPTDYVQGIPLETLVYNMITISDNNSTNILISEFGMDNLNNFFAQNGYNDTVLQRKMLDTVAQAEGRDNFTSLNDVMTFLKKLYLNKDQKPYSDMLEIMKNQQVSTKIRCNFETDTVIANKTGELYNVENDIGIIFGENDDVVVAFLCSSVTDTAAARYAISNASFDLVGAINTKYSTPIE